MEWSPCDSSVSSESQHLRNGNSCISISSDNSVSICSENRFLEDFDTYWDELGDRLSISQTVQNSIMQEMVKAVCEDAKDKIASKEMEISLLNKKISKYRDTENDVKLPKLAVIDGEITKAVLRLREGLMDAGLDLCYQAQFERFRASMEGQIQALKGQVEEEKLCSLNSALNFSFEQINHIFGVLKAVICENRWEHELQKEVSSIVLRSCFEGFYEEFESKLQEKLGDWKSVLQEFNTLREELNSISTSLLESDTISATAKMKDHDITSVDGTDKTLTENEMALEVYLKHMTKAETIDHFKGEITKMRRQHEIAMHEKTEEVFKLKRELLKERSLAPLRKDKDFEYVRQRLPEVITKLDEVMLKEVQLRVSCADKVEEIRRLEGRINQLVHENRNLKNLLEDTRKAQSLLDDGILDKVGQLSAETEILKHRADSLLCENRNLTDLLENTRKAWSFSETELLGRIKDLSTEIEDMQILSEVGTDVNQTLLAEILYENSCQLEDQNIQMEIVHKEGKREIQKLNKIISAHMGEIEKFKVDTDSRLVIQNKKVELITGSIETLQEKVLHEASVRAVCYQMELEKQRELIDRSKIENQNVLCLFQRKEEERKMVIDFISDFMEKIVGKFTAFENRMQQSFRNSEKRLATLVEKFGTLSQQLSQSRRSELLYKQILEIRTSNLAKAEAEVDLLGDEVDALMDLLGKIYIALDHYSPVFVHYPGVMEILKIIKKELQCEN